MRSGQKRYFSLHCTLLSIHVGQVPKQTPSSTLVWFKWTRKQTVFRGFKCWHTVSLRCSPKFISFLSVAGEKSSQRKVRWSRLSACHVAAAPITFRNHIHETFFFFFFGNKKLSSSRCVENVSGKAERCKLDMFSLQEPIVCCQIAGQWQGSGWRTLT